MNDQSNIEGCGAAGAGSPPSTPPPAAALSHARRQPRLKCARDQPRQILAENPADYFRFNRAVTFLALAAPSGSTSNSNASNTNSNCAKIEAREKRRLKPQDITSEMRARVEAAAKLL